ncbi:Glycine/sarcosine/betaine reductase complex component A [bioreactor metagenome]|jgi:betaine reductase|uniref:Glycine reductase complex selenoprotein A n=3 Tax=root TaxID=1 RepID=A0A4R8MM97_9BACT|nr:glycine reductase complex selenoprotein A [Aminivibrio pyruvatiphilus]
MAKLAGKKVLLLGERDGVPGPAMEACLKDSGADIVFSVTECFV